MAIDLTSLSPKELEKLISNASREKKRKLKRAPLAAVRKKLTRQATAEGYSLYELFGVGSPAAGTAKRAPRKAAKSTGKTSARKGTSGRKVAPKYRNPDNAEQTWTGRGKQPLWFAALINAGKTREDLQI
ncbi:H-NS family nucleoid-associated regulatory protein [Chiayiivirga flava]|uniref:DNA-binding protein H-NS n=1 Tax=Chiayiivirga flava TaxID=659595 RepID=A0A7W8D676_9GAMM|nr:H-NS histone family protein [Chiayiivirga flava]MBB5208663.1 DNA-binding protein H-NS [Chiayiivirga flava]